MTYFSGKDMSNYPSQEMDRFNVRLPAGMRDAIAERAKSNGRSMNSEIVQILQDALDKRINPLSDDDEVERVYLDLISTDTATMTDEDFDKNNEKIDWLIEVFMDRVYRDTRKFKELLKKKNPSRKDID